jgi:hypothetical protein
MSDPDAAPARQAEPPAGAAEAGPRAPAADAAPARAGRLVAWAALLDGVPARLPAAARALRAALAAPRTWRDLAPLVLPLALYPWIRTSFKNFVPHTLYFDAINYQYTAWCIRHGERLYDTVAAPDGPFITMLHALVQVIVGDSDHAFRRADLWIQTLGSAAIGAALAPPGWLRRAVWAPVGAAIWLSYYLTFDWHWTIQREAYYSLFGYLGAALMYASVSGAGRGARAAAFVGGALAGMQLFGKHSGVIFVGCGLFAVLVAARPQAEDAAVRRARARSALAGVAAGVAIMLACIVVWGSLRGFVFWYLQFPAAYRNAMVGAEARTLLLEGNAPAQELAAYALFGGLGAIATGLLPPRALGFALAPAASYVAMALQRKGYPYHLHPVHAGACVLAVMALSALFGHRRQAARWTGPHALAATVAIAVVGVHAVSGLRASPWLHEGGHDEHEADRQPHTNYPAMLDVARYLREHTGPRDRVFTYGPAPQVLFSAARATAVPEFDNYFFNVRRATTAELSPDERRSLDRLQARVAADACPRLARRPAAMVFCDGATWSRGPGVTDAAEVCPELRTIVDKEYRLAMSAGCWQVYLRNDLRP